MTLSTPLQSFGIHQAVIRDPDDDTLYPIMILDSAEPDFTQELIDNRGGSSMLPWASAPGEASGEIAMTIKQYSPGILKFFSPYIAGSLVEDTDGDPSGYVSAIVDSIGTSVVNATTGIASIAAQVGGTLRCGDYIVKAASATSVDIYVNTNVDGATFVDDSMKITSSPITIPGSSATVSSNGITFTGGSGTVSMTIGDTATFSVRPINDYTLLHYIGKTGSAPKEFELNIIGEAVDGNIRIIKFPRCIASGGGVLKFRYKEWAQFDVTIKVLAPSTVDYVGVQTFIGR